MGEPQPAFLLSLPRSGSTLLQRMLGSHTAVATAPESWVLLPNLFALRPDGVYADYGHATSVRALRVLCDGLADGEAGYRAAVRAMAETLYGQLSSPGSRYFLDKTPRYNLAVEELLETFPGAPMIILWRNPLAVIASIVDTWLGGRWQPYHHKVDLFDGLERLLEAYERRPSRFLTVRYEDLVADPRAETSRLLSGFGLAWEDEVVSDFQRVRLSPHIGDQRGPPRYQRVSEASLQRWRSVLASPVRKAWCMRYLDWLGSRRLALMGYEIDELRAELASLASAWRQLPGDALATAKGVAWSLVEPDIMKGKLRRLPDWRRVHSHT